MCTPRQRRRARGAYTFGMQLNSIKITVAAFWALAICVAAFLVGNFQSSLQWAVIVSLAILPPFVMVWRWKEPRPSMSESIQDALR